MVNKKVATLVMYTFLLFQSSVLMAEQAGFRGKVLKFNGDVEVVNAKGEKRSLKKVDEQLNEYDTIVTRQGARVVVQFNDGALSVLDEKSRLRVEKNSWFSYLGGKVYFTFKKVFGPPRNVRTRTAIIGIRGTTFIISENSERDGESIALQEGMLQIESTGPAFEIHRKQMFEQYEQFKQQHQQAQEQLHNEFDQYKRQTTREFVEYRRNFTLLPNRVINVTGYRVDETAMTPANETDFETFESEAEDLIRAFRDEVDKVKKDQSAKQPEADSKDF